MHNGIAWYCTQWQKYFVWTFCTHDMYKEDFYVLSIPSKLCPNVPRQWCFTTSTSASGQIWKVFILNPTHCCYFESLLITRIRAPFSSRNLLLSSLIWSIFCKSQTRFVFNYCNPKSIAKVTNKWHFIVYY